MKKYRLVSLSLVVLTALFASFIIGSSVLAKLADSKVLPKGEMKLGKDSQSDKYGEVAFNHDTHSFNKYSIDGKSDIGCAECHHTDQPASALQPPLKTAERKEILTKDNLDKEGDVKSCRSCHLQVGDDSKENPVYENYGENKTKLVLNNEVAYHLNCNVCHDKAIAARPALKGKIPGSADCGTCHVPLE